VGLTVGDGLRELIRADLAATIDRRLVPPERERRDILGKFLVNPRIRAVLVYRISHVLAQRGLLPLALLLRARTLRHAGVEIHPRATIGGGLYLVHSTGIVVGPGVVIGRDCTLHQGAVLGEPGRGSTGTWGEPTLGDNVTIGAHAVVLGKIRLGDRCVVGANSVVTKDVPDDAVVAGIPAKVIRVNTPPDPDDLESRVVRAWGRERKAR
jgi:serine O-acetyltransferase